MKKMIKSLICTFLIAGAALLAGCHDPEDTIDTLELDRALSPLNFDVKLEANVNAICTWKPISTTRQYMLSLIKTDDGSTYRELKLTDDGSSATMTYKFLELPGNTKFRAELVALSTTTGNSKPAVLEFETGIEQLFLNDGIVSDDDITATTAVMRWIPESSVTHLEVDNGIGRVDLDEEAIRLGSCQLIDLTNGTTYTVRLCRDDAVRGTCTFVASDKATVEVIDKTGSTVTVAWSEEDHVTALRIEAADQPAADVTLTPEEQAARSYQFTGLQASTEYTVTFFNEGVESGNLTVTTLGQATVWDFTTWEIANWTETMNIQDLTIIANGTSKNVEIRADADYGVNYLDLRGKSTAPKDGAAPSDRSLKFSASEEGVLVIDCYANGSGRNFYVYSDQLGTSFGPVEAPVQSNKGKVYIPCPGVSRGSLYIWTDATINHIYSIQWYAGSEAPGQNATPLDAPAVKAQPAEVTKGEATEVTFSWDAVANAETYEWRIKVTHADETVESLSGETDALSVKIDAAVVGDLKPGNYTMNVVAKPAGEYKFRPSPAGSAVLTVSDTKLSAPAVTLDPARVEVGTSTDVVASWAVVENAASYDVTFNGGQTVNQTETSFTIAAATVAALAEGSYTISVVAKPAAAGMQASDAGEATLTVFTPGGTATDYTMTLSATAGVLSPNISGIPSSWKDATWTATDDTGASTITFTGNIYYSTSETKNIVWYFNKGKAETHVSAAGLGKVRKITIFPNSARKPELLTCTYGASATPLAAVEPTGTNSSTITFDFAGAGIESDDFRIDFTDTSTNIEVGKVIIEYTN